jgi:predicted transposase YbfD/YdcC
MIASAEALRRKSRLEAPLDHFAEVEHSRDVRRITYRLDEILLLVVCGTIADCDDYEGIVAWGAANLDFLRRHLPYKRGVPGERWLTVLLNRINPVFFAAAFADWVRENWPDSADLVAVDWRQSAAPLHLVSAFGTTARLVLAQEAVPDKGSEFAAIPPLIEQLGAGDGLKGALVSVDAIEGIETNADVATAITAQGAHYLLAVKASQPSLRAEVEAAFAEAEACLETHIDFSKSHGRLEHSHMTVLRQTDCLNGNRRFPGELRVPGAACLLRAKTRAKRADVPRIEYFISSRALTAAYAAMALRERWTTENRLHWVLDVTFADDQSRLRKGHGGRNMATVRHFALFPLLES